jgi:nitrogen fixation protein FixH
LRAGRAQACGRASLRVEWPWPDEPSLAGFARRSSATLLPTRIVVHTRSDHSTKSSGQVMKDRDLMAPDTEPTDEELALVMREARELAVQERAKSDAWIAARLEEAARYARENTRARQSDPPR